MIIKSNNKKTNIIKISDKGKELYSKLSGRRYSVEDILLSSFTKDEIKDMEEKLNKMYVSINYLC